MQIYNALQTRSGALTENKTGSLTQPIQFIPSSKKTEEWAAWNIDWIESQGIQQVKKQAKGFIKNIKLANGIIDKTDYVIDATNDYSDVLSQISTPEDSALDLKFFPIIPNIINLLSGEFSKRTSKLMFVAVDDTSNNEMLQEKMEMLEKSLMADAEQRIMTKMIAQGMDPESPEAQQAMSPEGIKSLPEIQEHFQKNYRSLVEEWATHQKNVDEERFHMQELEEKAFRQSLMMGREFWHFKMNEDDYEMELWDPVFTFYQKSFSTDYISNGNHVGKFDLYSVSDVIDKYGYLLTEDQMMRLEGIAPVSNLTYNDQGTGNDGSFYKGDKSYDWNTKGPSLGMRQLQSIKDGWMGNQDIMSWLTEEDGNMFGGNNLIRATTIYWKTQRKLYHLTRITKQGDTIQDVVDDTYKITDLTIYNNAFYKEKTKDTLIYGEHLDPIWINEVWGGVKLGSNANTSWRNENTDSDAIYIGINKPKPGKVPFQFKGDLTLYGCKLPVEGASFSDRHIKDRCLVDHTKAFQVNYNLVNNQISDILVDELGTILTFDQNTLPKHSMGEDWGKGNMAKAYVAMKDFSMLPLDHTLQNTEGGIGGYNQMTSLDLSQTNRLMSRIQLANFFKQEAMAVVGITPERIGSVAASQSATGTEQAVNNSYAQTEKYFTQHSDNLMPRVHQMRTDLAQHYNSIKPSLRLQYTTSMDERVNFKINGTQLLGRDINVFATTKVNHREILRQMKELAMKNNTSDASIYDLGNILKSDSISEVDRVLKASDAKVAAAQQAERDSKEKQQQAQLQAMEKERIAANEFEAAENELDRKARILEAQIKASGFGNGQDVDTNGQSDYLDNMKLIQGESQYQQTMGFKREQENNKVLMGQQKLNNESRNIQSRETIANKQVQVAMINKNKFDKPAPKKK